MIGHHGNLIRPFVPSPHALPGKVASAIKSTGDPAAGFAVLRCFRIGAGMRSSVVVAARVHFRCCQVDSYSLRRSAIFSVPFHFKR